MHVEDFSRAQPARNPLKSRKIFANVANGWSLNSQNIARTGAYGFENVLNSPFRGRGGAEKGAASTVDWAGWAGVV